MKYNLRLDKDRRGAVNLSNDFTHAKYLVLYSKGDTSSEIVFGLTGESEVVTKDELLDMGYPDPSGKLYLSLGTTDDIPKGLKVLPISLSGGLIDTTACVPQIVKYTNFVPPEWAYNPPDTK